VITIGWCGCHCTPSAPLDDQNKSRERTMKYWLILLLLLLASNSFGQDKITKKAIETYLKSAENAVIKKDIKALMATVAYDAIFTMYEEHNGEIKHYHFDRDSYKKAMLDTFKQYPDMKKYKIVNIKPTIDRNGQNATVTYDLTSTVVVDGTVKDYLTKSTEEIVLRDGKILLVKYQSVLKY